MTRLIITAAAACMLPAQAVVITSGDGTGNTTAPTDDPGFANVGTYNGASVAYLGNQWVLTAAHVAGSLPSSVTFGGTSYTTQAGTWKRLDNNGVGTMTALTDIVLFRLASDPGLPSLTIRSAAMVSGDDLIMIGNGRNRQVPETHWDVTVVPGDDNDIWTEVSPPPPGDRSGFKSNSPRTVRWGENEAASVGINVDADFGDVRSFSTEFTEGGFTHEAQGLRGDSGGSVFYKNGGSWELAGIMHAIATFENQPADTAVYGNLTYSADLSFYKGQIDAIVAVPESGVIALILPALLLLRRRR